MNTLPEFYYWPSCYWAHMITFRCNGGCPYCILNSRGKHQITPELSGKDILNFWNNIEHPKGQKLSLIGGETTLHKDVVEIINNLENYDITITTNCKGPFYDGEFYNRFKPHPSSTLRINTTFHPHVIKPEEYISIIKLYRNTGYFVDQTSYVKYPNMLQKYLDAIDIVSKEIEINPVPYLGFYNDEDKFQAPFCEENLYPNKTYEYQDDIVNLCGLTDLKVFKKLCGGYEKKQGSCVHPFKSLMISPDGYSFHCHYKLYYGIDPVCHISNFKTVIKDAQYCNHMGFSNICDIPRLECIENPTIKPMILNKLYDKREGVKSEINYLIWKIKTFAEKGNLEFNPLKWFEYSYALLYSGHRHRGKVLDIGSGKSVFPYYLKNEGYDVETLDINNYHFRKEMEEKFNVKTYNENICLENYKLYNRYDLVTCLSVIEHIENDTVAIKNAANMVKPGGILVISTDFYKKYIEYPDANRILVIDRPEGSHTDSRVYDSISFIERIINPLEEMGMKRLGLTDYSNVDITNPEERAVRGIYTFGVAILRKET